MCLRTCVIFCACVFAALARSAAADEHPWSGVYVSVVSGAAQLEASDERAGEYLEIGMPLAEGDRLASGPGAFVEIALRNGVRAWLDADTGVFLQRIFDGPALLLERGILFVHVPAYAADDVYIDIVDNAGVDARISVRPGGMACVKLGSEFPLIVDLWAGKAAVEAAGSSVNMYPAQRLRLNGDREFVVSDFVAEPGTGFEVQSLARLRKIEDADRQEYVESPLPGIDELEGHGRWYYDAEFSARVWRPYAAPGWRPFYNGRWMHHPRGLYWLAHDPWGGVTYHYGAWRYSRRGYWCWVPGYVFTPAAVRFYSSGDYLVWVPMGMHTRFTYGTWWPDDYYRYAVMCRRGSFYKARGRHCSGRHKGRGGCDDDRFERPKPGSRREVTEVKLPQLPAPKPVPKPKTTTATAKKELRLREPADKHLVREKPAQASTRMPEPRQGNLQVVPGRERTTLPDNGLPPSVKTRPRPGVESGAGQGQVFNPQPTMPRSPDREIGRVSGDIDRSPEMRPQRRSFDSSGGIESPPVLRTPQAGGGSLKEGSPSRRQPPEMRLPRRSSERPDVTESPPPVFRTPQSGTGSLTNGTGIRRPPQAYGAQPRMHPSESRTERRNRQDVP